MHSVRISAHFSRTHCAFLRISGAQIAGAEVEEEEEEGMEVPKEVVEVLKNAQVKLQDCLDCVYEDRDPPNESDCLAADRTHTLAKLMNNNTVAQLEAIFDFEDMDEPFGIAKTKKKDTNKKKAYYVAYLIICLKHNCGADMPGWKLIPNIRTSSSDILSHFECIPPHSKPSAALALSSVHS